MQIKLGGLLLPRKMIGYIIKKREIIKGESRPKKKATLHGEELVCLHCAGSERGH